VGGGTIFGAEGGGVNGLFAAAWAEGEEISLLASFEMKGLAIRPVLQTTKPAPTSASPYSLILIFSAPWRVPRGPSAGRRRWRW